MVVGSESQTGNNNNVNTMIIGKKANTCDLNRVCSIGNHGKGTYYIQQIIGIVKITGRKLVILQYDLKIRWIKTTQYVNT